MTNKKNFSAVYIIIAACLWGCMGTLVRTMSLYGFDSMEIVFFRALVTSILMLIISLAVKKDALKIKLKDIWCFACTGIVSVVFFNVCYFSCMNYTNLSVAAVLLYTAPIFVMIMSRFIFKEIITGNKIIALLLAFAGCICVSGLISFGREGTLSNGGNFSAMGILTGLGAGLGYALYSIFGKFAINRGYSSMTITTYTFLFGCIGSAFFINPSETAGKIKAMPLNGLLLSIFIVFGVTVLAYLFYTKGLENMEGGRASVLATIEPVVATLVGVLLYKESLSAPEILGVVLVLTASIMCVKK